MDRVDDRARVLEAHALADAVGAAGPAGVDQPGLRAVLARSCSASSSAYLVGCQTRNGGAEAGREGRLRLGDAHLGAGDLGRVAADEVVHRLLGRQLADRRQHAERVAGQEDDVASDGRRRTGSWRWGCTRSGSEQRVFSVIDVSAKSTSRVVSVVDDVLEHRAEADRVEDLRLASRRQVDRLGVAAALDVEDAVVGPAVLVVADQLAARVGRQRRLAGAGEAEEERHVAVVALVGRAVHRQDALLRHQVVHDREDALLHLAGVLRCRG